MRRKLAGFVDIVFGSGEELTVLIVKSFLLLRFRL